MVAVRNQISITRLWKAKSSAATATARPVGNTIRASQQNKPRFAVVTAMQAIRNGSGSKPAAAKMVR